MILVNICNVLCDLKSTCRSHHITYLHRFDQAVSKKNVPVSVHVPQWIVKRGSLTNGVKVTLKGTSQTSIYGSKHSNSSFVVL